MLKILCLINLEFSVDNLIIQFSVELVLKI
jgi:hypothetical protein